MKRILLTMILLTNVVFSQEENKTVTTKSVTASQVLQLNENRFIENIGQYEGKNKGYENLGSILYAYEGLGNPVLFTTNGVIYIQKKSRKMTHREKEALEAQGKTEEELEKESIISEKIVSMQWENANLNPRIVTEQKTLYYLTYGELQEHAYGYKKITYKELYPGIDLVFSFNEDKKIGFEYSFIVNAGANVNDIKIRFGGDIKKIKLERKENLIIESDADVIKQSLPVSYYSNVIENQAQAEIVSRYELKNNVISFSLPEGYDNSRDIVIDPFVTSTAGLLAASFQPKFGGQVRDLDYDYAGNIYAGGGDGGFAKFNSAGVLQWIRTFNKVFAVDKNTSEVYFYQGPPYSRLNVAGTTNTFSVPSDSVMFETWKFLWYENAGTANILVGGGTTSSPRNFGNFTPASTSFVARDISAFDNSNTHDVVEMVMDRDNGDIYLNIARLGDNTISNRIFKVKAPYSTAAADKVWDVPTGYSANITELDNRPYARGTGPGPTSSFDNTANLFAVNGCYVFYYDGKNIKAFNKATGAVVGTPTSIAGNIELFQGGIAADNSNNIYVGSKNGTIKVYKFDGTTFDDTPTDITIAGNATNSVYDLEYDVTRNFLYAGGNQFLASIDLNPKLLITTDCTNLTATATVTPTPPPGTVYELSSGSPSILISSNTTGVFTNLMGNINYTINVNIPQVCKPGTPLNTNGNFIITAPTVTANKVDASCGANNGSITATGGSGTTPYSYSIDGITFQGSGTFTNLSANTYTVTVKDANGCKNTVIVNIINGASNTWNGTTWNNGAPTLAKSVIINGNYDMTTQPSIDACSVTVNSPFIVTVVANKYLNIQNDLTVNTGAVVDVLNGGTIVQINDSAENSGNIIYRRTTSVRLADYVYWSSPVNNFVLGNVSPATPANYIWSWNPTITNDNGGQGNWTNASGNMLNGKGYILRAPTGYSTTSATAFTTNFNGTPNNGVFTPSISRGNDTGAGSNGPNGILRTATDDNWNLLGNPYPSAISINSFLTANTANIDGFVRLWTHGTLPNGSILNPFYGSFASNYTAADYIAVNGTGSTSGPGFSAVIGAGQGFFVLMNPGGATTSTVTFNNSMRDKAFYNSQFYKTTQNPKQDRIWLDFVSTNETSRTLIGYIEGATNDKDQLFDAFTDYKNNQNFYSLIQNDVMAIQGRSLPFNNTDIVPLGIKTPANGMYTIAIAAVEGLFENNGQAIYLEDKLTNTIHNLSDLPYQFSTNQGIVNNRFVLRYTNQVLNTTDFVSDTNAISIFGFNDEIKINSLSKNIVSYEVYDVLGRTLYTQNNINKKDTSIIGLIKNNQALIVKTRLENGQVVTKKVIF